MTVLSFFENDNVRPLGFYYDIAEFVIFIPLVLLLAGSIAYNILVGLSIQWMYDNTWKKKVKVNDSKKKLILPIWEEIFVVNLKISNFLLGGCIALKEDDEGYLELQIHDYKVFMPLAMILIQVSQFAVAMTLIVLFMDHLVLQVSNTCGDGKDCYSSMYFNRSSTPVDCSDMRNPNVTCFELDFNPVIAASVTGGFLKTVPHILFSSITYQYLKYVKVKYRIKDKVNYKVMFCIQVILAIFFEICFIGVGVIVLVIVVFWPPLHHLVFHTSDPTKQLTYLFIMLMYFMMASFLWSLYPQSKLTSRFKNGVWKKTEKTEESEKLLAD